MCARIQPNSAMTKRRIAEANLKAKASLAEESAKASPRHYKRAHAKNTEQQRKPLTQVPKMVEVKQVSTEHSSLSTSFVQSKASRTIAAMLSVLPKNAKNSSERMLLGLAVLGFVVLVMIGACCFLSCCLRGDGKKGKQLRNDFLTSPPSSATTSFDESQFPRKQHMHEGRVVYEWSQSEGMAYVFINVPEGTNRQDLDIKISSWQLEVGKVGKPAFMTEEIYSLINQEGSGWRLRSSGELQIHLAKKEPGEWPCMFTEQDGGSKVKTSWSSRSLTV
jgi:hypothetical protein